MNFYRLISRVRTLSGLITLSKIAIFVLQSLRIPDHDN